MFVYTYIHAHIYMYVYTYTHTRDRVHGHYCTGKICYPSSPEEGSRGLQLCRASSWVWAHSSSSGYGRGHERGLHPAPTTLSPAMQERTAANLWKTLLQGHGCTLEPANPQSSRLVLLQKQHHRLTGHNFPCTMQLSSCGREFQFISCFLIFLPLQLQQGC